MALHILLLMSSILLLKSEREQLFKQPLVILNDCRAVQSSGRAMSLQLLNIWTVFTVFLSILYLSGILIIGALPTKLLYHAAGYHLLTIFLDYSFMAGLRDCSEFDTFRWRVDAFLRCTLYSWTAFFIIRNATEYFCL